MAYIEISDSKFWSLLNVEMYDSEDERFAEKIMKYALKTGKEWGADSIDYEVLVKMRNWCDKAIQKYDEE